MILEKQSLPEKINIQPPSGGGSTNRNDPMKYVILVFKLAVLAYLVYLLFFLLTGYEPASSPYQPPFVIFILDTINLFIHEAGHFFLRPFGMVICILGGSLIQCLLPLALVVVTLRTNMSHIALPGFWLGENLVNVSVYIKDAPYKHLRLIAQGLIHDWNWLLSDNLDLAASLGTTVFATGLLLCAASVVGGVMLAIRDFKEFKVDYSEE